MTKIKSFSIIMILFLIVDNYEVYSQKSEIDNFEYTQELCEPKYWINIFDNFYTDSSKILIKNLNQDSISFHDVSSFQFWKSKKCKIYKDYNGSNLRNISLLENYFDFIFDKIYSHYNICDEYKRKYKYLTKDRFKDAIFNSYYNYLKFGKYDYDRILDSVNNIFIEENKYEDAFIPLD